MRHVNTDLVRPARFQTAFDQTRLLILFECAIMGDGMLAFAFCQHSHFLAIGGRTADPRGNRACRRCRMADYNSEITSLDIMPCKYFG